ncbi:hypothetical protein [Flavobacterium piscis]|uniref:Uncharacterized protein n=1 Tax=Flavobacterium piscis TaxID=1114874 RepID=A0ABU1YEH5_9FLAO|nr:hypothetical protein [Flavobacterium piscis]MDR7212644.1 hypothetical protein [Flavobacterium piscis]
MAEEKFPGKIEIALSTGIQWAKKFRDLKAEEVKKVSAYLIPLESLEAVLRLKETQNIDAVRAYVGINESGEQNLMFVGAKLDAGTGVYKDVFGEGTEENVEEESVVYDGSRPCPPFGDPESPI